MMQIDIKYIKENYIELNKLCKISGFTETELNDLIEKELIPNCSYEIETQQRITSSLRDELILIEKENYFAKSHVSKLEKIKNDNRNENDIKSIFKRNFISFLKQPKDKVFAYGNLFNQEDIDIN